ESSGRGRICLPKPSGRSSNWSIGPPPLRPQSSTPRKGSQFTQNSFPDCKSEITPEIAEGMCPQCRELRETVENWHLLAPTARKRILTAVVRPALDEAGPIVAHRGLGSRWD